MPKICSKLGLWMGSIFLDVRLINFPWIQALI